eukprot:TRINITY_DN3391_c0_g2_i1.p1 TRINITY_DN3391_c0_g2~~TRINITY_DN3391_c0_g2_i1.p1  ORF type:complete len:195 (-),score=58.52 TRINITY_DN3391_c0_g2_i1:91-675(-)
MVDDGGVSSPHSLSVLLGIRGNSPMHPNKSSLRQPRSPNNSSMRHDNSDSLMDDSINFSPFENTTPIDPHLLTTTNNNHNQAAIPTNIAENHTLDNNNNNNNDDDNIKELRVGNSSVDSLFPQDISEISKHEERDGNINIEVIDDTITENDIRGIQLENSQDTEDYDNAEDEDDEEFIKRHQLDISDDIDDEFQ